MPVDILLWPCLYWRWIGRRTCTIISFSFCWLPVLAVFSSRFGLPDGLFDDQNIPPVSERRRNFTKDEIVAGLKAGRTLIVDRRDAPELDDLLDLERRGLVEQKLVEFDDQSSAVKWRWKS